MYVKVGQIERVAMTYTYILMCKIESKPPNSARSSVFCSVMAHRGGAMWVGGRKLQSGVDICILIADSCCCTIQTGTTL